MDEAEDVALLGGRSLKGVGDWTGDGVDELAIYTYRFNDEFRHGYLFLSAAETGQVDPRDIEDALLSDSEGTMGAISKSGDINHDGYADVAYSASGVDRVFAGVAYGPIEGAIERSDAEVFTALPPFALWSGDILENVADMDGDGWVDLTLVLADYDDTYARMYIVHGPLEGTCTLDRMPWVDEIYRGSERALLEDINGDALPDLAVHGPWGDRDESMVHLLPGTVL